MREHFEAINHHKAISFVRDLVSHNEAVSVWTIIDDVISHGQQQDWADLHQAVLADRALLDKIERLCRANINNPYDPDSYAVWMRFVQACRATDSASDVVVAVPDIPSVEGAFEP